MTEETFVLLRYSDKETADTICAFLVDTFPYCKDGRARVEENLTEDSWTKREPWAIVMAGYMKTYTSSMTKAHHAARDFVSGYKAAREKANALFTRLYREKLKSKSDRGAAKEGNPERIKAITWDDPVGLASGIKCKRVGVNGHGEHFIYSWGYEPGWKRIHGDVDTELANKLNLPEPKEDFIL